RALMRAHGPALMARAPAPLGPRTLGAPHSWGPALMALRGAPAAATDGACKPPRPDPAPRRRGSQHTEQPCGTTPTANSAPSPPALAVGAQAAVVQRPSYSETELSGKARAKNAQWAALVVRALRPIIPKTKIVKPHAVRRSLRARMTGSLDPTRHTDGEENA